MGTATEIGGADVGTSAPPSVATRRRPTLRQRARRGSAGIWFLVPALAVILVIRVVPIGYAGYLSLLRWDGVGPAEFVGLRNYEEILHDPVVGQALTNNLLLLATLPLWVFLPMLIAVVIWEGMLLGKFIRFCLIVPMLLSPAVLGLYFSLLLQADGPVNRFLGSIGLGALEREWLVDSGTVVPVFIAIVLWGALGMGTLLYSAGMGSIDDSLFDAAELDGAGFWTKHRHVTVPHLRSVTSFWAVFVVISFFTAMFPLLFTLTNGGPGYESTTIDLYVFQLAYNQNQLGYSTALGLVTLLLLGAVAIALMRLTERNRDER